MGLFRMFRIVWSSISRRLRHRFNSSSRCFRVSLSLVSSRNKVVVLIKSYKVKYLSMFNNLKKKRNKSLKIMLSNLQILYKNKFYKISKIQSSKPQKRCTPLLMTHKMISKKKWKLLFSNK